MNVGRSSSASGAGDKACSCVCDSAVMCQRWFRPVKPEIRSEAARSSPLNCCMGKKRWSRGVAAPLNRGVGVVANENSLLLELGLLPALRATLAVAQQDASKANTANAHDTALAALPPNVYEFVECVRSQGLITKSSSCGLLPAALEPYQYRLNCKHILWTILASHSTGRFLHAVIAGIDRRL